MSLYVVILSGGWAVILVIRAFNKGHVQRVYLPLALVLLCISGYVELSHRAMESDYSEVASGTAGRTAHVHCERALSGLLSLNRFSGYVPFDPEDPKKTGNNIFLKGEICDGLKQFKSDPDHPTSDGIVAVHVLTHEAKHVSGTTNEAQTECQAMQHNVETAMAFGASREVAEAAAYRYWQVGYPKMSSDYRSTKCAKGQEWDEDLPTSPWNLAPNDDLLRSVQ